MPWHDPHTIPEPVLVLSGLSYFIPAYMCVERGYTYTALSNILLCLTTVGFHGTRNETLFAFDCIAILNYIACGAYNSYTTPPHARRIFEASLLYSLVSYFVGQQLQIMSFDPNWNRQMAFHAFMHLSSVYSALVFIAYKDINNHRPPSEHYRSLLLLPPLPLQNSHH